MSAASKRVALRADALSKVRRFFEKRGVQEVDPLILSQAASIDAHIDLFATEATPNWPRRFLFSSPEYAMNRLLSEEVGDIYYLGHVFREEPQGIKHSPEFLMAEWYRVGFSFQDMIEETADLLRLFLGNVPLKILSYKEAFLSACHFNPFSIEFKDLLEKAKKEPSFSLLSLESYTKDDLLNLFLTEYVEHSFENNVITAFIHYPKNQAALAQTVQDDEGFAVAERFELFFQDVELANGYHELQDAEEQKRRLEEEQRMRVHLRKDPLIIDRNFLKALQKGLPDCCGVAVGIDRLLMLQEKSPSLASIYPISWEEV